MFSNVLIVSLLQRRFPSVRFSKRLLTMWEVKKTDNCGRTMIATADLLPGSEILTEKCLILIKNEALLSSDLKGVSRVLNIQEDLMCFHRIYQQSPTNVQLQVNDLFCPTMGAKAAEISNQSLKWKVDDDTRTNIVKLSTIMSFNSYDDDEGRKLFKLTSLFSHSCVPNCSVHFSGQDSTIRAILPIRSGEEMTLSYDPQHTNKPTHERRSYLTRSKEFLCECPRCRALGDDTRQFNCFNPKCTGRHCVCQPTSTDTPYLLPCSVCKTVLSDEYQSCLLSDEQTFIERYDAMHQRLSTDPSSLSLRDSLLHFPLLSTCHSLTADIASEKSMYYSALGLHLKAAKQAKIALKALQSFITYPSLHVAHAHHTLGLCYEAVGTDEGLYLSLLSLQKAVQLQLLLQGREKGRDTIFDENLLRVSKKLDEICNIPIKSDQCALCGAISGTVHMSTKCSCKVCHKVMYCSMTCKSIHHEVHCMQCGC